MRVIVTGAVAWSDGAAIRRELSVLPSGTTILHGDCAGADALAGEVGRDLGFTVVCMKKNAADRVKYGRLAWMGLNERMLAEGVDLVLAFHPDLAASKGSRHMVEIAQAAGVPVRWLAN